MRRQGGEGRRRREGVLELLRLIIDEVFLRPGPLQTTNKEPARGKNALLPQSFFSKKS